MKLAVFDPMGNWGGASRVIRKLLPAIKNNEHYIDIVYYGNSQAIDREGLITEFGAVGIQVIELKSTRLSTRGFMDIKYSNMLFKVLQNKTKGLRKLLPVYLSGAVEKEIQYHSKNADLAFFPWVYLVPYTDINIPAVAIFHDFNYKYYFSGKSTYSYDQLKQIDTDMPLWLEKATPVVSSKFIKSEINKYYPKFAEKTNIVYLSPMNSINNISDYEAKQIINKFNLESDYILYPTNICSHKNIGPLLSAMALLKDMGVRINLVLTGPGTEMINGNSCDIGLTFGNRSRDIIGLGYVTNTEIDALIHCAGLVISTSLYEAGNGPGLEAWAKAVPVAMSNIPSFLEHIDVQGVKAGLFDPRDPSSIATCVYGILKNYEHAKKDAIESQKAISKYTWGKTALEYVQVFNKTLYKDVKS